MRITGTLKTTRPAHTARHSTVSIESPAATCFSTVRGLTEQAQVCLLHQVARVLAREAPCAAELHEAPVERAHGRAGRLYPSRGGISSQAAKARTSNTSGGQPPARVSARSGGACNLRCSMRKAHDRRSMGGRSC